MLRRTAGRIKQKNRWRRNASGMIRSAVGFMYGWVKAISLRSELMLLYRKPPRKSTANEQKEKDVIISLQILG
jgi:hypothetical protein